MLANDALRGFVARLIGWSDTRAVDLGVRSLRLAACHLTTLVVVGGGDMVPVAWGLHRRTLGADRPFVACDPRRHKVGATARSPANFPSGVAAVEAASGGSLCVRARRLPRDFRVLAARLQAVDDVTFVVCIDRTDYDNTVPLLVRPAPIGAHTVPLLLRPAPIVVPPIGARTADLDRVIAEYVDDAAVTLGVLANSVNADDRALVRTQAASTLEEIEKATLRLVAIKTSESLAQAAKRLGMAPVSLERWANRRRLLLR